MIVLDASVAIKWFLKEKETEEAVRIVDCILLGKDLFAVPELFYFEVFTVVMRRHQDPKRWANTGMRWLLNLPLEHVPMTAELSTAMADFTNQGLSGYDAAYAALALRHHGKWLTYDHRAKEMLSSPPWIVSRLS